ncbi:MAG: ABC transporter substrate-binding protein [Candidatus Omnitrophota bacterium]
MRIKLLIIFVFACVLLCGCSGHKEKVYHVGILSGLEYVADIADGFKAGMAELGYVEGKNITYDLQRTDFDMAEYKYILDRFIKDKVDLIFVFPTEASLEAKAAVFGTNIPVVFSFAQVEGVGLIDSVRHPGNNITGVRYPGPDIALKRFEIMLKLVPNARRICVPYQRDYPIISIQLEALYPVAAANGVILLELPASDAGELEDEFKKISGSSEAGIDAILIIIEPLCVNAEAFLAISKFAAGRGIPVGGALISADGYESLFGVNVNNTAVGAQAAPLADKIFRGMPAGDIPVVSSESYFQLNYKAAKALGFEIPEDLLSTANEVIR